MPSDMRALGRLGDAFREPSRRARRRPLAVRRERVGAPARRRGRIPRSLRLTLLVALVVFVWVGAAALRQDGGTVGASAPPTGPEGAAAAEVPPRHEAGDRTARSVRREPLATPVFAEVDDLSLLLPHPDPILVAFHEATRPEALPLLPVGRLLANDNPTKFTEVPPDADGPDYRVLSSRGRARPATSAVDVALPEGAIVSSPVDGTVVEVREYALYGGIRDWRIVIEPADRPDLHVVLIHLEQPRVQVGDEVTAGLTPLAAVRTLGFTSQIDYVTDTPHPHTHLEVKPAAPAEPLDPNAPALPADAESP